MHEHTWNVLACLIVIYKINEAFVPALKVYILWVKIANHIVPFKKQMQRAVPYSPHCLKELRHGLCILKNLA